MHRIAFFSFRTDTPGKAPAWAEATAAQSELNAAANEIDPTFLARD